MTSDRDKCGLSSLLPMSCRGRAEAFARRLHSRLRSLGSQDGNGAADESSWLAAHENPVAVAQPRHSDSDLYFDLGVLESPGSPEDDGADSSEFQKLINQDHLKLLHSESCHCAKGSFHSAKTASNDSDSSDGPFYDTENDITGTSAKHVNGLVYSDSNQSDLNGIDDSDSREVSVQDDIYITSSECTLPNNNSSISEDVSTLSLRDDDCASLDLNAVEPNEDLNEVDKQETYSSSLSIEKELLTVECPIEVKEDEEVEERIPRVRRCSSLKTGKTPPGTPSRKKIVRFADVLGLDLADVRTFLDEIPKVPTSAYEDLKNVDLDDSDSSLNNTALKFHGIKIEKILVPLFQQPGGQPNFLDRVRDDQVCLENAIVEDPTALSITGVVRVRNLDFNKSVHIRYSLDQWQSFADIQAVYVQNSCDGFSDKFSFLMYAHTLTVGQRLEFAVRFQCRGCQYWDNNKGANYCFQCLPSTNNATSSYAPITGVDDNWGASFYYQEEDGEDDCAKMFTHTAVQEFIAQSLRSKEHNHHQPPTNDGNLRAVFIVLMFAVLLIYLQKVIFTK